MNEPGWSEDPVSKAPLVVDGPATGVCDNALLEAMLLMTEPRLDSCGNENTPGLVATASEFVIDAWTCDVAEFLRITLELGEEIFNKVSVLEDAVDWSAVPPLPFSD